MKFSLQPSSVHWLCFLIISWQAEDPHTGKNSKMLAEIEKIIKKIQIIPQKKKNTFINFFAAKDALICMLNFIIVYTSIKIFFMLFSLHFVKFLIFLD